MKRVTRNVDLSSVQDLLERVPRARLAYAAGQEIQALPVKLVWRDGHYLVGIPADTQSLPAAGQEVVLLVDEGVYYFDLRAIYIRGQVQPVGSPFSGWDEARWFEVIASKTIAWDYGSMREVQDES